MLNKFLVFFFLTLAGVSFGQEQAFSDSVKTLLRNAQHDSVKVNIYDDWATEVLYSDPVKSHELVLKMDSICLRNLNLEISPKEQVYFETKWAIIQNYQGEYYRNNSNYEKALECYEASVSVKKKYNDKSGEARSLGNIGLLYLDKSNYTKSFEYLNKSLKINEEIKDSLNIASNLLNMGLVFYYQANYDKALGYFKQSYGVSSRAGAKTKAANTLNNIGAIYFQTAQIDSAEYYFAQSLELREELNDKRGMASSLLNLGLISQRKEDLEVAMDYFLKSRAISEELGDKGALIGVNINIGSTYAYRKMYDEALKYTLFAYEDAVELGDLPDKREAANTLYLVYEYKGDFKNAYKYHKIYIETRDSIVDVQSQQQVLEQEASYAISKQHLADSLAYVTQQEIDKVAHEKDLESEANRRYILYGGILVLFVIAGLILRSNRQKKKDNELIAAQKEEVEKQKAIVELTHKEIRDSIDYAKRIQSAILPNQRLIKSVIANAFIYYQPKDVVAGDFYWVHETGDLKMIASADCTGHGVPGAMVSVVCHNALNRAVREFALTDPGLILDKAREIILDEFADSDDDVKDGMDISLVVIKGNELKFAGANNPLWILRNRELIEYKGDKQPVGKFDLAKSFESKTIKLEQNDQLYLFTDGIIDQFGGEKGKKFKANALRELIKEIGLKSMGEQKIIIQKSINQWMGDLEQVDDMCMIGIQV